jgi:GAF domain-containing protein/HAMP domain-containing protein
MKTKTNNPRSARSLTATLAIAFFGLSVVILLVSGSFTLYNNIRSLRNSIASSQLLIAQDAGKTVGNFIQDKFIVLEAAVEMVNPITASADVRKTTVESLFSLHPAFRQIALLDKQGRQLAQASHIAPDLSPQFALQLKGDAITQTAEGQRYISPVYIDDQTSEPLTAIAIPVTDIFGDIEGTLIAEIDLKFMWELVDRLKVGETGYVYVVDNEGNLIAFQDTGRVLAGENVRQIHEVKEFLENPSAAGDITPGVESNTGLLGKSVLGTYVPLGTPEWAVVTELPTDEGYQPMVQSLIASIASILLMAVLAGLVGVLVARRLSAPLINLSNVATEVGSGNLSLQAEVAGPAEIAKVAATFNTMTAQLRDLIGSLEQRVTDRTKALSSVAEVSTVASTILETDKLLQQVVNLTKERFGFYHAHVYLLNEAGDTLVLASGAGEPGRQMVAEGRSIPIDREQSLVAHAARAKKGVTVNDVTTAPDFLPHPLLPDTRSELAVPMMVGETVIGVFDVQSEVVGRFTDADIAVQTTLASQVASAVQNARSYSEVQRSQALLSEALNISRLANWEYDFEHDLFNFNDHFYSIFRTTVERVGGYKISSADYARNFVHPDDQALVGSEIQRVLETKELHYSTALEHRIVFADGEVGYISVRINVERDGNGKILRWYGANQDVTERRRLEELNRKRAGQQETINLITQRIQSATTIEDALQVAVRDLGRALGKRQTLVSLEPSALSGSTKTIINE